MRLQLRTVLVLLYLATSMRLYLYRGRRMLARLDTSESRQLEGEDMTNDGRARGQLPRQKRIFMSDKGEMSLNRDLLHMTERTRAFRG